MSGEEDLIFNLKTEVLRFAAAQSHRHDTSDLNIVYETSIVNAPNSENAPQTKAVKEYVNANISNAISNYPTTTEVTEAITDAVSGLVSESDLTPYVTKEEAEETYAKTENYDTNMLANPMLTEKPIDDLLFPGYYKYVGTDAFFTHGPDNVHYTNGLIKVERQSNRIIQHVCATSYSIEEQQYKIDGREYRRYGYVTGTNEDPIKNWVNKWYATHIPWRKRNDLLEESLGANVTQNGITIYECTAGYVINWIQSGQNQEYKLTADQYKFAPVCTFKKELPILAPFVFGNIIGHADIKITKEGMQVRSLNRPGEYIVGVNGSYFVPRDN